MFGIGFTIWMHFKIKLCLKVLYDGCGWMPCLIVLSFGLNDDGQCGVGKSSPSSSSCPLSIVQFPKSIYITSISAGSRHALALSSEGLVFSWGWGLLGQLGHGNCISVNNPCVIWKHCIQLVAIFMLNQYHLVGCILWCIVSKGSVYTWGSHNYGLFTFWWLHQELSHNISNKYLLVDSNSGSSFPGIKWCILSRFLLMYSALYLFRDIIIDSILNTDTKTAYLLYFVRVIRH